MEELKLTDRVVLEVFGKEECTRAYLAELLRQIADQIEFDGRKGGFYDDEYIGEPDSAEPYNILWERENMVFGGMRMGNRSLISDAYYGEKEFFEVCSVSKEDIEQAGFDSSKLSEEDMQRIASKQGDLITDCCDYWTALEGACEYWEVPTKEED